MIMVRKYGSPLLVSVLALLMAQGSAQSPSNPPTVAAPQKFDVASIRPSLDRTGQPGWMGVRITGDMFEARSMSLKALVWYAYASVSWYPAAEAGSSRSSGTSWQRSTIPRLTGYPTQTEAIACDQWCRRCLKSDST